MGNPWAPPEDAQPQDTRPQGAPPHDAPPHDAQPAGRSPERPSPTAPPHPTPGPTSAAGAPGAPAQPPAPYPPATGLSAPRPLPQPDPAGVARATRTSAWTAGLLLLSVLVVSLPWPAMVAAPVAAVAALVLAILAVVRAVRARARGSVLVLPVVLVMSALAWVGLSTYPLLYLDASRAYAECTSEALTAQARRTCTTQLEKDTRARIEEFFSRAGVPTGS